MSLDRSLKSKGTMAANRSVFTRAERIGKLLEDKKIDPNSKDAKVIGLAKTRVLKK
jgi:small basic protein (TIGR04137 family)